MKSNVATVHSTAAELRGIVIKMKNFSNSIILVMDQLGLW